MKDEKEQGQVVSDERELRITNYELQATCSGLSVLGYGFSVLGYEV
jgi:hypothetical protein